MNNHKLPDWMKKNRDPAKTRDIKKRLRAYKLHTVCEEARCPNISECFEKKTATFMILGKNCTRNCSFCAVGHGSPDTVSEDEPGMILNMVRDLGLRYVVITSVTRDDLPDGGAGQFCRVIDLLKGQLSQLKVEVLIPDFKGDQDSLFKVLENRPDIINHNLETVRSLYSNVRPQADFDRSLNILRTAKEYSDNIYVKTGIMVGLGEKPEEIRELFQAVSDYVDIITIGQYISPSRYNYPEKKFYTPGEFKELEETAYGMGIRHVISGPFVRSSYNASSVFNKIKNN